jgi:hypothetical protein
MSQHTVTLELGTAPPKGGRHLTTFLDMFESVWLQRYLKRFEDGPVYLHFDWTFYKVFRKNVRFSHATITWNRIARELWKRGVVIGPDAWFESAGAVYHHDVPQGSAPHVVFTMKGEA